MKRFLALLKIELKQFLRRANALAFGLLLLFSLIFVQLGINQYKKIVSSKDNFQQIERLKVGMYSSYTYYGTVGFRILFIPGPTVIFFNNSSVITDLTSQVDSADILTIYHSIMGKNIFADKTIGYKDFSGIILLFGSLLAIFIGYNTFNSREYLKLLSSLAGIRTIFILTVFTRLIILCMFFIITGVLAILLAFINGISFHSTDYINTLYFLGVIISVITFFFSAGTVIGTMKSKSSRIVACFAGWFLFVFFIPGVVNSYFSNRSEQIAFTYKNDLNKLKLLEDFEKRAAREQVRSANDNKSAMSGKELADSYLSNEFKRIQDLEFNSEERMESQSRLFQGISFLFPSTFYMSAGNEISSRGYENIINFHRYCRELKKQFTAFYLHKKFFEREPQVENFIKKDENVFFGKSRSNMFSIWGMFLTLIYTIAFFLYAFKRFQNMLLSLSKDEIDALSETELELRNGEFRVWKIDGQVLPNFFYSVFSGEMKSLLQHSFRGRVEINDVSITQEPFNGRFIYLCRPDEIPGDITVCDFILVTTSLMRIPRKEVKTICKQFDFYAKCRKKFYQLSLREKSDILLALTQFDPADIYLVNDIAAGLPVEFAICLNDQLEKLKEKNAIVIYLSSIFLAVQESHSRDRLKGFCEDSSWFLDIGLFKRRMKIKNQ